MFVYFIIRFYLNKKQNKINRYCATKQKIKNKNKNNKTHQIVKPI